MKDAEFLDRVVAINRTAKVVKGGRRFRFSAIVVVGDGKGMIGTGLGKAHEVPEAIRKGMDMAKKNMVKVAVLAKTIPYEVIGRSAEGTWFIAGGAVRAVLEVAGVHNILTKCLGSHNPHNLVKATLDGLCQLRDPAEIAAQRGK
jgi:small subunit ribosomal protein S5